MKFLPSVKSSKGMAKKQKTVNYDSVYERFEGLNLVNDREIVYHARKGVGPEVFYDLADTIKMPEKNLAFLINLSARTLNNYKEQKKKLEPLYAEHLLKLIALYERGEAIFGNVDEFNYWLNKPFWDSYEKPIDFLITPGGVDLVMQEVDQLAQGYPV